MLYTKLGVIEIKVTNRIQSNLNKMRHAPIRGMSVYLSVFFR